MTHFWLLSGFCTVLLRALWGCWNRVFLPCWRAKAHGLGWSSVLDVVWSLVSVSEWLQQCLAWWHNTERSWPSFSSSCACGSLSLGSKLGDFEVLKWLIFPGMLWQCPCKTVWTSWLAACDSRGISRAFQTQMTFYTSAKKASPSPWDVSWEQMDNDFSPASLLSEQWFSLTEKLINIRRIFHNWHLQSAPLVLVVIQLRTLQNFVFPKLSFECVGWN